MTGRDGRINRRLIGWGAAALLLAIPWLANFPWTASDFIVMGAMFAITGGTIELAIRSSENWAHRFGAIVAVLAGFLTVWVNLAVGMIGSDDNPYNLWFGGVLAIAISSALLSQSSATMAGMMVVTALAQAAVSIFGFSTDPRGGVLSFAFAGLWLLSAGLFWIAARNKAVSSW
jgi:hypothetical protein